MDTTEAEACADCGEQHGDLSDALTPDLTNRLMLARVAQMCEEQGIEVPEDGIELDPVLLRCLFVELAYPDPERKRWDGWDAATYRLSGYVAYAVLERLKGVMVALQAICDHSGVALHPSHADAVHEALSDTATSLQRLVAWPTSFAFPDSNTEPVDIVAAKGSVDMDAEMLEPETSPFSAWLTTELLPAFDFAYDSFNIDTADLDNLPSPVVEGYATWSSTSKTDLPEPVFSD